MIPVVDLDAVERNDAKALQDLQNALRTVGFMKLRNTGVSAEQVRAALQAYRAFFALPEAQKAQVDMAQTGSTRGWGGARSEQVDPTANPDFKEVFDCGVELPLGHHLAGQELPVYAPNLWPDAPDMFRATVEAYQQAVLSVAMRLLRAIARDLSGDATAFDDAFSAPMALLRGNYYPQRPAWAGDKDFGIAPHTDYGCITVLATDGADGLEVETADGWIPVRAEPGEFVINFGEMLEMWSAGRVRATPHRVIGTTKERLSIPLFFNPSFDANVAPEGAEAISAGDYLTLRYQQTYVHLSQPDAAE